MALGSLTEFQNQVIIAKGVGYLTEKGYQTISEQAEIVHKLINGLIKGTEKIHNT